MQRLAILFLLIFFLPDTVTAQSYTPAPGNGGWGDGHSALHKHGTVRELMERTGTSCCEGEHSGECRKTHINGRMAWLDGQWCKIPEIVTIFYDIPLPSGMFAVVCAGRVTMEDAEAGTSEKACPAIYCAAATPAT